MTNEIDSSEDKAALPQSFGAAFREAREQAGFSIERAAVATRISASFIEALENQKFDVLPGEIFGRGFVRNLCRVYGCDAKPLVVAYDLAYGKQHGEVPVEPPRDLKTKPVKASTVTPTLRDPLIDKERLRNGAAQAWKIVKPVAIALPVLLGVLWVGQMAYQSYRNTSSQPESLEPQVNVAESPAETVPAPAEAASPTPEAVPPQPAADAPAVVKGEGSEFIDILVKEPVDIRFGRDKDKQVIETFASQSYRLQFNEQLRLYVTDMSRVEIRFKGQVIPNKAKKGEARYMTFAQSEEALAKNREKTKL